jgi:hypothetical protein
MPRNKPILPGALPHPSRKPAAKPGMRTTQHEAFAGRDEWRYTRSAPNEPNVVDPETKSRSAIPP